MPDARDIDPADRFFERIDAIKPASTSLRQLSIAITGKPDLLRDVRRKKHLPSADNIRRLAEELDTTVDYLLGHSTARDQVLSEVSFADRSLPYNFRQPEMPPIPLVGTGDCASLAFESDTGEMVDIERSTFDPDHTVRMIARPPALRGAREVYAIYFHGESMMPRFEPGEIGIVDPSRPPAPGDYVLVQMTAADGESEVACVLVKRLVRSSSRELVLQQFNPPVTFTVPRGRVVRVHRILQQTDLLIG